MPNIKGTFRLINVSIIQGSDLNVSFSSNLVLKWGMMIPPIYIT